MNVTNFFDEKEDPDLVSLKKEMNIVDENTAVNYIRAKLRERSLARSIFPTIKVDFTDGEDNPLSNK